MPVSRQQGPSILDGANEVMEVSNVVLTDIDKKALARAGRDPGAAGAPVLAVRTDVSRVD